MATSVPEGKLDILYRRKIAINATSVREGKLDILQT